MLTQLLASVCIATGTNGVLSVTGAPSELPALKGTRSVLEFGLSFELGHGQVSI
jgi:hypothetical protein